MRDIRQLSTSIIAMSAAILLYRYINDEALPNSRRKFYKFKRLTERAVEQEQFEDEVTTIETIGETPVKVVNISAIEKRRLTKLDALKRKIGLTKLRCEASFSKIFDPLENKVQISGENAELVTWKMSLDALDEVSFALSDKYPTKEFVKEVSDVLKLFSSYKTDEFIDLFQSILICDDNRNEMLVDSFSEIRLSSEQLTITTAKLYYFIHDSLKNHGILPNKVIHSINNLRILGRINKKGPEFFEQLDEYFREISEFDDYYFEGVKSQTDVESPSDRLQVYIDEMEYLSQTLMGYMLDQFPEIDI
jgi:hypothetical protein